MSQLKKERLEKSETIASALTKLKAKSIIFDDCNNANTYHIIKHNRKAPKGKVWVMDMYHQQVKLLPLDTKIYNIF